MDSSPENEEEREFEHPLTHHPTAPLHESFEISTTVDPSYVISMIRKLLPSEAKDGEPKTGSVNEDLTVLTENDDECQGTSVQGGSDTDKIWEDCGCLLWDLSASEEHARFMVQNLILEVLHANLVVSPSSRITEICLGIIGNISCHEVSRKQISSTNGLVGAIVEQLLLDDVPCLCEACRALTLCLQGDDGAIWSEALQVEPFISRILWIAENALNPLLLSKIVGLFLAVSESDVVSSILLPPLMKLNFSSLLVKLLAFEIGKLREERQSNRFDVLDLILRTIEALSTSNEYSQEVSVNKTLWELVKEMIELPDKLEVANSCVTAAVLFANMIADSTELASLLSQDMKFIQGVFDVFPFASDDTEAKSAIWSIIARLLTLVHRTPQTLHSVVSILATQSELIEDQLLDHSSQQQNIKLIAMKKVGDILRQWKSSDEGTKSKEDNCIINHEEVDKILRLCDKLLRKGNGKLEE